MKRAKITHQRRNISRRIEILDELLSGVTKRNYADLLKALNNKIEELGDVPIQTRTLKSDISYLEYEKGAPIHRPTKSDNKVYYKEKFSLKTVPVDDDDIAYFKKAVAILRKATDSKLITEVDAIISRLENKIHTNVKDRASMIAFEEHTEALGKEYFDELFSAIYEKSPIKLNYQPFGKDEREWLVHPYMLKEYRNRWFLIGRVGNNTQPSNIRLDSIKGKIKNSKEPFIENDLFDPETYFNNMIGVSFSETGLPEKIVFKISNRSAEYIRTKPIHRSQNILKTYKDGSIQVEIMVIINYELISTLLSYGSALTIISPVSLRDEMKQTITEALNSYS